MFTESGKYDTKTKMEWNYKTTLIGCIAVQLVQGQCFLFAVFVLLFKSLLNMQFLLDGWASHPPTCANGNAHHQQGIKTTFHSIPGDQLRPFPRNIFLQNHSLRLCSLFHVMVSMQMHPHKKSQLSSAGNWRHQSKVRSTATWCFCQRVSSSHLIRATDNNQE